MKVKVCKICGQEFLPVSNSQKYCKRDHYSVCEVCGKQYVISDLYQFGKNLNVCSKECRAVKQKNNNVLKFGTANPCNSDDGKMKSQITSLKKYGTECPMQSELVKSKMGRTVYSKYRVHNVQNVPEITKKSHENRNRNWIDKVHKLLPLKMQDRGEYPRFLLRDDALDVYILTEEASKSFLAAYGIHIRPKFRRKHLSLGCVKDGILYQVIRFELDRNGNEIVLSDFGTRYGYYDPNHYCKLVTFARNVRGIDDFSIFIPRSMADDGLISSFDLEKVSSGNYEVYWKLESEWKRLTQRDNIEEMLKKYDYVTSDYLDEYRTKRNSPR